jgi:VanZ family protein
MIAPSENANLILNQPTRSNRFWRYAPLAAWLTLIFFASTGELNAANTSLIVRPLLLWLFPNISEAQIGVAHFMVRKAAHFTEYSILALLAVRAFTNSSHKVLRRQWFWFSLLLIALYALSDEFHQSFVPSRTASIYDSLIDVSGGLTALIIISLWRKRRTSKGRQMMNDE